MDVAVSGTSNGDNLVKKCNFLKRKCEEYEEMNEILLARTKKIHTMIEKAEKEKRFLVKRLEQFEVQDSVPSGTRLLLNPDSISDVVDDEKALLAAAVNIRSELNAELAHAKSSVDTLHIPYNAHHNLYGSASNPSPSGSRTSSTTSFYGHKMSSTSHQSPVASVIVTPTSLVPATVPAGSSSLISSKPKKKLASKAHPIKGHARGSGASKRKKPDLDPNAPKKPSNAFFWFCQERRAALQEQFRGEGMSGQHDLTKALAKLWSETGSEEKKKYYHKYTADKARYDREMEEYTQTKQGTGEVDASGSNATSKS